METVRALPPSCGFGFEPKSTPSSNVSRAEGEELEKPAVT